MERAREGDGCLAGTLNGYVRWMLCIGLRFIGRRNIIIVMFDCGKTATIIQSTTTKWIPINCFWCERDAVCRSSLLVFSCKTTTKTKSDECTMNRWQSVHRLNNSRPTKNHYSICKGSIVRAASDGQIWVWFALACIGIPFASLIPMNAYLLHAVSFTIDFIFIFHRGPAVVVA